MDRNYDVITFFSKNLYFKKTLFADITKIVTRLSKQSLQTQEKLEEFEIMYLNGISICISWYSKICWFLVKNADVSRTQGVYHVIHIVFESSLGKGQISAL